jgi:hypothetical protein
MYDEATGIWISEAGVVEVQMPVVAVGDQTASSRASSSATKVVPVPSGIIWRSTG